MTNLDDKLDPIIFCEQDSLPLIRSALHKIGHSESIALIRDVFSGSLRKFGDSINLHFINQGFSNTIVLRLQIGIIKAKTFHSKVSFIAKLGHFDDVSTETANYKNLIRREDSGFVPDLVTTCNIMRRWGIILYEDLGNTQTFYRIYLNTKDGKVCGNLIDKLFNIIETAWLNDATLERTSMFEDQFKLVQHIHRYQEANKVILPGISNRETVSVPIAKSPLLCQNPLSFILSGIPHSPIVTHVATVHGDMHSENILVDIDQQSIHLIDFANMESRGHIFKDYVKLEANIWYRLYDYDKSHKANAYDSAWLLLFAELLGFGVKAPRTSEHEKLRLSVSTIRRRASNLKLKSLGGLCWEEEYLVGLLHWTLASIYWIDIFPPKKQFAFYAACLISDAIKSVRAGKSVINI
jgi:hypothetical protein